MSTPTPAVSPAEPALSVSSSGSSVPQEERLTRYLWHLLFFVSIATLFEGYDAVITGMALPYLGKDFGVGPKELGFATSVISIGTIVAFVPVRLADRYGRRPLLLLSVSGYSLFTILTAFSSGLYDFVVCQFVARALMVTEIGVGAVVLAEELPARYRGIGVAVVIGDGALGCISGALGYAITTTFPGLLRLRLFHGLGPALFVTACYTKVSRLSPPQRLGEALTYITLANNVARAVGPAGGVYMAKALGFPTLCLAAAGIAVWALLAGVWPAPSPRTSTVSREASPNLASIPLRVSLRRIALPVAVIFLALMSFGSVMSFFPLLAAAHGVDNPGVFFTVTAVTLILTRVFGGRITDVYGRARIVIPSLGLMAAGMFVLAAATSALLFNIAAVLCASGVSLLVPTLMAATIEQIGAADRGWAVGIFTATMDLSMAVGTVGSGVFLHLTAAYPLVFGVSGGCVLLSLLVFTIQAKEEIWHGAKVSSGAISHAASDASQHGDVETSP